jgi:aspartate/methionine/tyrosine aminotransferase
MSITVTNPACKVGFIANGVSANASGCEEVVAAVASKKIKVRHLTVNTDSNITITIGEGETTSAVTTALIGPITFAANSSMQWDFNPPMELTTATALTVDASGSGNICVFAQGVIE